MTSKQDASFSSDCVSAQTAGGQALEIARHSVEACVGQSQQLSTCSNLLEHQQSVMDQSARLVRGMTWSGWFYNLLLDNRRPKDELNKKQQQQQQQTLDTYKQPESTVVYPAAVYPISFNEAFQQDHLSTLSNQLSELKSISNTISKCILHQNTTLDSMDQQCDTLMEHEKMLIRQMSRRTQQHPSLQPSYIQVGIQHVASQRFVSIQGTSVVLVVNTASIPIFHLYLDSHHTHGKQHETSLLIGLQYQATGNWLGYSKLFASVVCSSTVWGTREQWEVCILWMELMESIFIHSHLLSFTI